jgi:hypothetical protein
MIVSSSMTIANIPSFYAYFCARLSQLSLLLTVPLLITALLAGCADTLIVEKDQDLPGTLQLGSEHRGGVSINPTRIALPDGTWTTMGADSLNVENFGAQLLLRRGALGQIIRSPWAQRELGAMVYFDEVTFRLTAIALPIDLREVIWEACNEDEASKNAHFFHRLSKDSPVIGCWSVTYIDLSKENKNNIFVQNDANINKLLDERDLKIERFDLRDQLKAFVSARGVRLPTTMAAVTFWGAIRTRAVSVTYLFNPDLEGIPPTRENDTLLSDWHMSNIDRFPKKAQFVSKLNDWGARWQDRFIQGVNRF